MRQVVCPRRGPRRSRIIGGAIARRRPHRRLHELPEVGKNGLARVWVHVRGLVDQQPHLILGGERDRDQFSGRGHAALANHVERVLHVMGERGEGVEAEHRAGSLDRVERAERGIDQLAIARRAFEVEQRLFQLFEQVLRFLQEDLVRIAGVRHPRTFLTMATN